MLRQNTKQYVKKSIFKGKKYCFRIRKIFYRIKRQRIKKQRSKK